MPGEAIEYYFDDIFATQLLQQTRHGKLMATLQRAVASLNLTGEHLNPVEITQMLGSAPTRSWRKGDNISRRADLPPNLARQGAWSKKATPTEPENLDAQVRELLGSLTSNMQVWRHLSEQYRLSLFCGWYMSEANVGVLISPSTLSLLGERCICLDLDIYSAEYGD